MDPPATPATATGESAPAPPTGDTTMELLVVLTVNRDTGCGVEHYSHAQVATVSRRATRMDVLQWALSQLPERLRGGGGTPIVAFFSAEPNQLTTAAG